MTKFAVPVLVIRWQGSDHEDSIAIEAPMPWTDAEQVAREADQDFRKHVADYGMSGWRRIYGFTICMNAIARFSFSLRAVQTLQEQAGAMSVEDAA